MTSDDFHPDLKLIAEAPDREGTEKWVLDTQSLEVYAVTSPDRDEDTIIDAEGFFELFGKVHYAKHTGLLSHHAVDVFTVRLVAELNTL